MKQILIIHYSQTGQLSRALKATIEPLRQQSDIQIDECRIEAEKPYPYPWSYMEFFDAFPETVHGVPCKLKPLNIDATKDYDLIVLAYQPWFLSVSIPINSFLQSKEAEVLLKGKKVLTILACRNMWLNAQEKMKMRLKTIGAELVGNIAYVDKSGNLTSLITVLAFALGGVQDKFLGIFPKYGVSDKDLKELAPKLGQIVGNHLNNGEYQTLQTELVHAGGVVIKKNLMIMEGRGKVLFPIYANYISKKGGMGSKSRRTRVRIFGIVLPIVIFIFSPLITLLSRLLPLLFRKKFEKETQYFQSLSLR